MRKRDIKVGQLVEVKWVDSSAPRDSVWIDPEDIDHRVDGMVTVGWVQHVSKDIVTLAASLDLTNGWVGGVMTIPLRAIDRDGIRLL